MKKIPILLFCLTLLAFNFNAQIINDPSVNLKDTELWTGIDLSTSLKNDDFSLSFSQNIRFNNNIQKRKSTFSEFGIAYEINKKLKLSANFRYIYNAKKVSTFRPLVNLKTQIFKSNNFKISHRFRYQKDFNYSNYYRFDFDHELRNKFIFEYDFDKFTAAIISELFARWYYKSINFNQLRLGFGLDYKVNKRHGISLGYTYREEFNISEPLQSHIMQIGWGFKIKGQGKKKKDNKLN